MNLIKSLVLILVAICFPIALVGCLSSETAGLTTTQGQDAATVDANPGIKQGQEVTCDNTTAGAIVNEIDGNNLILSLPAVKTGTATATFKNSFSMQLADDAAGIQKFTKGAAAALIAYAPQIAAVANDGIGLAQLVQQITSAAGWTPATPSQHSVYTELEKGLALTGSSATAVAAYLTKVQSTGSVSVASN